MMRILRKILCSATLAAVACSTQTAPTEYQKKPISSLERSELSEYSFAMNEASSRCAGNAYEQTFGGSNRYSASAKANLGKLLQGQLSGEGTVSVETERRISDLIGQEAVDEFVAGYAPCMLDERDKVVAFLDSSRLERVRSQCDASIKSWRQLGDEFNQVASKPAAGSYLNRGSHYTNDQMSWMAKKASELNDVDWSSCPESVRVAATQFNSKLAEMGRWMYHVRDAIEFGVFPSGIESQDDFKQRTEALRSEFLAAWDKANQEIGARK